MKNIIDIIESIKIGSKTKVNKISINVIDKILKAWGLIENTKIYKDANEVVTQWVEKYDIEDVYLASDKETINEYKSFLKGKIIKPSVLDEYDTSDKLNELCQDYLDDSSVLLELNKFNTIYGSKYMICLFGTYGALYCINSKIMNK